MTLFRTIFWWTLAITGGAILASFAIHNTAATVLDLWPAPIVMKVPLFVIVLAAILIGFLIGALVMWIADGRTRRKAREAAREQRRLSERLEQERAAARQAKEAAQAADPSRALRHSG